MKTKRKKQRIKPANSKRPTAISQRNSQINMLKELIALDYSSKVWIYQSDKELTYDQIDLIRPKLFEFAELWTAHNANLDAYANIFHKRFIGIFVDETRAGASGCSIDKSVHFVEMLGEALGVDFFNRMLFCYLDEEEVNCVTSSELKELYKKGQINNETLVFDNLVKTKIDFLERWVTPFKETWMTRFV